MSLILMGNQISKALKINYFAKLKPLKTYDMNY